MRTLQGIAVSPGVAFGDAYVLDTAGPYVVPRRIAAGHIERELARFRQAHTAARAEIEENRDRVREQLGRHYAAIFDAHLQMLEDRHWIEEAEARIRESRWSAEYAVTQTLGKFAEVFEQLPGPAMVERAHDIRDIQRRLLQHLCGCQPQDGLELVEPAIVLAHDLTPSQTARLDPEFVLAFATEAGGVGGHTAILAKAKGIPAVVGLGPFLRDVASGDRVAVDGDHGQLVILPDADTLRRLEEEVEHHRTLFGQLEEEADAPARTVDGVELTVLANIEFPHEVALALRRGAGGVGLYRSEFLYLATDREPTEADHLEAYEAVARSMAPRPVVIRTLDLGADKLGRDRRGADELNPFLGLRSIRLSLRDRDAFRRQLRAILRASDAGNVAVMFPMIATLKELREAKKVLEEAKASLDRDGIAYDRNLRVGMMVEVPAAVVLIDRFLQEVDFVSIGTNDLIQYTLAVDRANRDVAALYQPTDPAVLRLLDQTIRAAEASQTPLSVCGQMGSHPLEVLLLLGLGVRTFSVPPPLIPEVKAVMRKASVAVCADVAQKALACSDADDVRRLAHAELRRIDPDLASLV